LFEGDSTMTASDESLLIPQRHEPIDREIMHERLLFCINEGKSAIIIVAPKLRMVKQLARPVIPCPLQIVMLLEKKQNKTSP